ncbi:MAG: ABC transporter permease [Anaerolineaceae bacterium]|nr:ABC transporter permease [Anaerolineaceae bacterium]
MIFRNSIKSIVRSRGKTALFLLLIFSLTLALALGVSVWASVAQFLEECDEYYTTIGLLEYMGTGYPDDSVYDVTMAEALDSFDDNVISSDASTLSWETPQRSFGYIDGFWRTDGYVPGQDFSVLVLGQVTYDERHSAYRGIVFNAPYSVQSKDNSVIYIDDGFADFEENHYYLVFGEIYHGRSPLLRLRIAPFENPIADSKGIEIPRIVDITSTEEGSFFEIPEDNILMDVARTLAVRNNSVLVNGTNNIMAQLPFHQEELYFVEGRAFTEDEYRGGSQVVVIPKIMADRLGIGVGDSINLSVATTEYPGFYNSYWSTEGFSYTEPFKIVGIFNTVLDKSWYVYVPENTGVPTSSSNIGYTIGVAILRNDEAADFYTSLNSVLPDRFQLTIYDQGYSSVAIPYQSILRVAKIITGVCVLVELAVLILFGFLFVYRQRETSETMLMLGSGKTRVLAYFLFSSGFISLFASIAGSIVGYFLHGNIIDLVIKTADNFKLIDSRYSNGNLTISKTLEFAPELAWNLFIAVGACVFVFAIVACLAFTISTFINSRPSQKKSFGPKREHKTSRMGAGSMKYALLSIFRGSSRSLVVPILAFTVVIFFGQLATTSSRYQEQLESIYDNTTIEGYYTDIHGKQIGNQVLDAYDINNLYHTGAIDTLSVTYGEAYYFLGITKTAEGIEQELSHFYVPTNTFLRESAIDLIQRGAEMTSTNDIRTSPEFYYADSIVMEFLDGYDESFLTQPYASTVLSPCLIPSSLMEQEGISLGDTIRVVTDKEVRNPEKLLEKWFLEYNLLVVGSYEKQGVEDTIYTPLSLFIDTNLIWGEGEVATGSPKSTFISGYSITEEDADKLLSTVLHSATFSLQDSHSLEIFKNYLFDYGYSQVQEVGRVRKFIVLKDAAFNNSVASVKQQIRYINTLYPVLYALVGIIAIAVSYLLVVSRKQEFATMRGLGAKRIRTFLSFFFEQSILCLIGTTLGMIVWMLIWGPPIETHLLLTAGFLACYFFGCAISITILNRSNVLSILLDRE